MSRNPFYQIQIADGTLCHLYNQKAVKGYVRVFLLNQEGKETTKSKNVRLSTIRINGRQD